MQSFKVLSARFRKAQDLYCRDISEARNDAGAEAEIDGLCSSPFKASNTNLTFCRYPSLSVNYRPEKMSFVSAGSRTPITM